MLHFHSAYFCIKLVNLLRKDLLESTFCHSLLSILGAHFWRTELEGCKNYHKNVGLGNVFLVWSLSCNAVITNAGIVNVARKTTHSNDIRNKILFLTKNCKLIQAKRRNTSGRNQNDGCAFIRSWEANQGVKVDPEIQLLSNHLTWVKRFLGQMNSWQDMDYYNQVLKNVSGFIYPGMK